MGPIQLKENPSNFCLGRRKWALPSAICFCLNIERKQQFFSNTAFRNTQKHKKTEVEGAILPRYD